MSGYSQQDMGSQLPMATKMPSVYSPHISDRDGVPDVEDIVRAEGQSELTRSLMRQYALELAKDPAEPYDAARALWPHDTGNAVYVWQNWPNLPEIQAYIRAVHKVVGVAGQLPTEDEYALNLWKLAKDAPDEDTRLKYLRLFAEATGQLKRPGGDGGGITVNQNRVMVVNNMGTDQQWSDAAEGQQAHLQQELVEIADNYEEAEVVELDPR